MIVTSEDLTNWTGLALIALLLSQLNLSSSITVLVICSANTILSVTSVSRELSSSTVYALVSGLVILLETCASWSWDSASVTNEVLSNWAGLALIALILSKLNLTTSITVLS